MRTQREYLKDILDQLEQVERFTVAGREAFLADDKTQYAVIRAYEIVGEAAKYLPDSLLDLRPEIRWGEIKKFRDYLIHNYHKITPQRVWDAVIDVPNLRAAVEALLIVLEKDNS